jgi:sulfopyruvate decarboxylase subunit alpha
MQRITTESGGRPGSTDHRIETASRSSDQVAAAIADVLAEAGADLVASLPDGWIAPLIKHLDRDQRFRHVPVNREESAIGLCSGLYFGGRVGVALMGASGFLSCIYAITKINYTYQIPVLLLVTLRGQPGDTARYHVSNALYLRPVIDAINLPVLYVERFEDLSRIGDAYRHASVLARPYVVGLGRDFLRGRC